MLATRGHHAVPIVLAYCVEQAEPLCSLKICFLFYPLFNKFLSGCYIYILFYLCVLYCSLV